MKGEKNAARIDGRKEEGTSDCYKSFVVKKGPLQKTTEILVDVASCHATCGWLP
jgi:hypothetical protein